MGYTLGDLNREIADLIDAYASGSGIDKSEAIAEIMAAHPEIEGDDADFAIVGAQEAVRIHFEKAINRIKRSEAEPDDSQGTLPGFEHIQQRYIVEDDAGRRVALAVDAMSAQQIRDKCEQLRGMGRGLLAHADELERYARETDRGW